MGIRRLSNALAVCFFVALFLAPLSKVYGAELVKTDNGIKAALKIDAAGSMTDLYLYDLSKALRPIKEAKVFATITSPGGKKVEKELMGMEMGKTFSFMSALDMSEKGRYIFDIRVEADKKTAKFSFIYDNR
ncbi:MAG: hypothetical protein HY893_02240 [Deltaproteobacteria bacterium]|nr:hypothetical protein [Deltaproteobacteria bacterium]